MSTNTSTFHRQLRRFSSQDPYERCAVMLGGPNMCLHEVRNWHPDPVRHFRISLTEANDVATTHGRALVGVLHTHPHPDEPNPSTDDMVSAARYPDLLHGMYHPTTKRLVWFDTTGVLRVEHIH